MIIRIYDIDTAEVLLTFRVDYVGEVSSRNIFFALVNESVSELINSSNSGIVYFSNEKYTYDIVKDDIHNPDLIMK